MGYAVYWENTHSRFAGYGVPCQCEHPDCKARIDRGLAHVCGDDPGGGEHGCGLYFCGKHLLVGTGRGQLCERCAARQAPHTAKPDTRPWMRHMLRDKTWQQWRDENPEAAAAMRAAVGTK